MGILRDIWEFGGPRETETTSGPEPALDGRVRQTFTFHATRLNAGHVAGRLREFAAANDLDCEVDVGSGLLTREIVVTVIGDEEAVSAFDGSSRALLNRNGAIDGTPGG